MKKLEHLFNKDYYFGRKNSNYDNYRKWDNDRFWKSVIKTIKRYDIGGNSLDVGCAMGFLLKREKSYFENICGIDISDFAVSQAKQEAPFAIIKKVDIDDDQIPFSDNYFDFITALDVLEHTKSIERSLGKILQKLKDDGIIMISIPLADTFFGKVFHKMDVDKTHISVPTVKTLFELLDKLDLEIIEKKYFLNAGYFKIWGIPLDVELVLKKKQ